MTTSLQSRGSQPGAIRRGAAAVEFAIVSPLLVIFTLGAMDIGQMANVAQVVSEASREGARAAAKVTVRDVGTVENQVRKHLLAAFPNVSPAKINEALGITLQDADGATLTSERLASTSTGALLRVKVVFRFQAVRWLRGRPYGGDSTLRATSVTRRE